MNKPFDPFVVEAKFDHESVAYLKLQLLRGRLLNISKQINCLKEQAKSINKEISGIIGENILEQFLQHNKPYVGQVVVNSDFDYLYIFDQDLQLRCINDKLEELK